ncbi:hypothetical protein [Gimesia panareensis]|uniref:hypothetical protein n=1 Tax=Gimesia panareensis TaxID=2527978 RepID=UPI00118CE55F|nr:hypothetical protein [Gimesia panareensis]QDU50479.1 hypothetical protein Pan110_28300 [Gimesia panareensis]
MSYSSYCKRNKIKLALSPYRRSGNWHSWRGYLKGHPRKYYKHPDTKDGYNAALSEFVNWQNSLKENREWAVEIQHHQRLFEQVEKWYSLHGIPEGEEHSARYVSSFLNWLNDSFESEQPLCPTVFLTGSISTDKGTDRTQNDFIIEFCGSGWVDESYLQLEEYEKAFQEGFGSKFFKLPLKWQERLKQLNVIPNLEEVKPQTMAYWLEKYIDAKMQRFEDGKLSSSDTVRDAEQKSKQFVQYLGELKIVSELSDENWEGYHNWLSKNKKTGGTKKAYQTGAKTFINWCKRQKKCKIRIPDNYDDPDLSFADVVDQDEVPGERLKELWTLEEIKTVIDSEEYHWKAFILLSLNCGFLASDLNELRHSQYENGRLVHKRKKSRRRKRVPIVNYKLWPKTMEAIEKVKTELAITGSMSKKDIEDLKKSKELLRTVGGARILTPKKTGKGNYNNLSRNWQNVRIRLGLRENLTLRKLRNTALTELKKSFNYRDLGQLWLGQAQSVESRHYHYVDGQVYEPLDKAIEFIADQFEIK